MGFKFKISGCVRWGAAVVALVGMMLLAGCGSKEVDPLAGLLRGAVGAPARLVWVQDTGNPGGGDYSGKNIHQRLKGLCSEEGEVRVLHHEEGMNYFLPLISADGETVVFTHFKEEVIYRMPWSGGTPEKVAAGIGHALVVDPEDGREWIYFTAIPNDGDEVNNLYRVPLRPEEGGPDTPELLWERTHIDRMGVSGDGKVLAVEFNWPDTGFIDLESGHWRRLASACWPDMAPDNTYVMWLFSGTHRALEMFDLTSGERWAVILNEAAGLHRQRVYHPRWSNHPDFFVFTGPYAGELWQDRTKVNLYLGRFSEDRREVRAAQQLTANGVMDIMPYLWVRRDHDPEPGDRSRLEILAAEKSAFSSWPKVQDHLAFLWGDRDSNNEFHSVVSGRMEQGSIERRGRARFAADHLLDLGFSWFEPALSASAVANSLSATSELTVEVLLHGDPFAAALEDGSRLLRWFDPEGDQEFKLEVLDRCFRLSVEELGALVWAEEVGWDHLESVWNIEGPNHLAVRQSARSVQLFINGTGVNNVLLDSSRRKWEGFALRIGEDPLPGVRASHLSLYNLALFHYLVEENAAAAKADFSPSGTAEAPTLRLRARVVDASPTPDPEGIRPYRHALVTHEYEVLEVLEGAFADARILVAHWAVMDGKMIEEGRREVGNEVVMTVQPQSFHPQLEGEYTVIDVEAFYLDPYYQIDF